MNQQSTALAATPLAATRGSDDGALAARCRAGDAAAWKELYDAHFDFVFRVARRLGTPEAEAEDVAHDVFVVAHRKLDAFQEGKMSTWLYRITAHVVSDRHRRRRVRESLDVVKTWLWGAEVPTPEALASRRSDGAAVERILARMSPKKREVLALFELEGLSGEQIAERVGCPVGTVWTRLHHGRQDFLRIARKMGCMEETA
ncbi:MAG: sigma-70 family RNA polymerase sigma factor [Myxococcales bacterium]|nr:sigma-70 family RNA polymerase sigma factor [Myxococcales bacterium]